MADAKQADPWPFASGQGSGLSKLRGVVDDLVRKGAALSIRSPWVDPLADLRGPQPLESPPRRKGGRLDYVADLKDPSIAPALTRKADREGFAYVEEYPAANLVVRTPLPELQARVKDFAAGKPVPHSALGPRITYVNDQAGMPTPRQPITTPTAGMVAAAILDAGLESANINSTTGGKHDPKGRHYTAKAVDINRVNGLRVGRGPSRNRDPNAVAAYTSLQAAFARQPNIRENFGPLTQARTTQFGLPPAHVPSRKVWEAHQNHVHASGQR
jgi:hypothetical protein